MKHTRTISTVLAAAMILSLAACQSGEEDSSQTDVPAGVAVQVEEVSRQTIGSLENGRYNPSILLAFRIARYFGMPIEEIFLYEED